MTDTAPEYGACRACHRVFVDKVTDPTTEVLHARGPYCDADRKWQTRNGADPATRYILVPPPGDYRCPTSWEATLIRLELWNRGRNHRVAVRERQGA